ncbi:CGNR zinc finger domain-containing protein [Micromonospora luteifusca]|uniref:CGNR zinc finger domain-containing protein n=1 Tax=Micromonospora luteifusca TaxID=709860 RepID=UPI0033ACBBC2
MGSTHTRRGRVHTRAQKRLTYARSFYEDFRSGAGRWCSMAACGNRTKTRTYRQ